MRHLPHKLYEVDLLDGSTGAKNLMAKLNELPEVQKIAADRKAANKAFVEYVTSFQK